MNKKKFLTDYERELYELNQEAAKALKMYLGAGYKEKRKEASEVAKEVYFKITGKEYTNE